MSRIARAVLEGVPHHITQRGNGRQVIFDTPQERQLYLDLLRQHCQRTHLSVWAYCLMSNHIHLVAVPHRPDSLARALGHTHAEYARYFNLIRRSCGHVWQARFFSCPLSGNYVWNAMAYVERNPVRAGLSSRPIDYQWSSARPHIEQDSLSGFLCLPEWQCRYDGRSWQQMTETRLEDTSAENHLREATQRGRPCADAATIVQFERQLGRILRPRLGGRPKKQLIAMDGQEQLFADAE